MHIYSEYSVLPALKKLKGSPFSGDANLIYKRQEISNRYNVFYEFDIDNQIYFPICEYISKEIGTSFESFKDLANKLAEDVIIHRFLDQRDWMAAGHICFPSHWDPKSKIGKPLSEIHSSVPGIPNNHNQLVQAMINHGPFERYVWGITFDDNLNCHPNLKKKSFDPIHNNLHIKIEKQITIPFPEIQSVLFVLHNTILLPHQIDYSALYKTCNSMNNNQRVYKGITKELMEFLLNKQ